MACRLDCGCLDSTPKCEACRALRRLLYRLVGRWANRCRRRDDPAERESRLAEYGRRAAAGLPLFEEAAA